MLKTFNELHEHHWYNIISHNTIQYNTIQYNTIQYNTIQYNTMVVYWKYRSRQEPQLQLHDIMTVSVKVSTSQTEGDTAKTKAVLIQCLCR